jgi:two-component system response regulator NreC
MAQTGKLRILLADDHDMVREGLKLLLNAQPDMEVVGEASNGLDAWQAASSLHPDVVIMDVSMPDLNGIEATMRLKQQWSEAKVLALTMHDDESYLQQLLQAGVSGYVLKRSAARELTRAVRIIANGANYLDPALTSKVLGAYFDQSSLSDHANRIGLSEREEQVLRLIASGYSNKEIAVQLSLSIKTVETYKARLMTKLGIGSRAELVRYALRRGWLS